MKNQNKSLKTRARNLAAGGLCGLAALISGCGSSNKLFDISTLQKPYVETAIVSDYVAPHGAMLEGQVRQDLVNVNVNDRLSAFIWQDYSNQEKGINERDFCVSYSVKVKEGLSASIGYQHWTYPTGTFGKYDNVLRAGIKYSNILDWKYDLTHMFGHGSRPEGDRHYLKASKTFQLGKIGGADISVTPSISTSLVNNYFEFTGLSQITPGAVLSLNKNIDKGKFSLNLFINDQHAGISKIKDKVWGGASMGYNF